MNRRNFLAAAGTIVGAAAVSTTASAASQQLPLQTGQKTVKTRFGKIACTERGSGPIAILVHGWPLNAHEWRNVLPGIADMRRCIAPDLLGFGNSVALADLEITPLIQSDMIVALMDNLHIREADFVANDSGGLVAQILTARYPDRVRSLLLTNCDAPGDNPPPAFAPLAKVAASGKLAELFIRPQLASLELARSARGIGSAFANPDRLTSDLLQSYLAPLVSSPERERQFNVLTAALGHDDLTGLHDAMRAFAGPVRIVWGGQDKLFSSGNPQVLAATYPGSRGIRMVADAKIYVPEDRPDVIIEEARSLWTA